MKARDKPSSKRDDEMLDEYDFSNGVRGKYASANQESHMVHTLSMAEASERLAHLPEQLAEEGNQHVVTVMQDGKPVLAVLPWERYGSVLESVAILGDAEQMATLSSGVGDLKRGETVDWAGVNLE